MVVYSNEPLLRHPGALAGRMLRDFLASRELAWRLFTRNLRVQYRQPLLGYLWLLLPPVVNTLIWSLLNSQKITRFESGDLPYPVFVLAGSLLWQGFADAINSPINQFVANQSLLAKLGFPREALILAGMSEAAFNSLVRLLVLVAAMPLLGVPLHPTLLVAPIGIAALLVLGGGLGLLLAPLNLIYPDVQKGLSLALTMWFFLTPVVYAVSPAQASSPVFLLNPVSPLLVLTRRWLTGVAAVPGPDFWIVVCLALVVVLTAWISFRLATARLTPLLAVR